MAADTTRPTTVWLTDASGRDVAHAAFRVSTPCAVLEWAARMVAQAARTEGAVVTGFRIEAGARS